MFLVSESTPELSVRPYVRTSCLSICRFAKEGPNYAMLKRLKHLFFPKQFRLSPINKNTINVCPQLSRNAR